LSEQLAFSVEQRRICDADADGAAVEPFEVAFDIDGVRRSTVTASRPALDNDFGEVWADLAPLPADHDIVMASGGLFGLPAGHAAERAIPSFNAQVRVKDHHAVGAVIEDGGQSLPFLVGKGVHPRVVDGNGGLVCKALQQAVIILVRRAGI